MTIHCNSGFISSVLLAIEFAYLITCKIPFDTDPSWSPIMWPHLHTKYSYAFLERTNAVSNYPATIPQMVFIARQNQVTGIMHINSCRVPIIVRNKLG